MDLRSFFTLLQKIESGRKHNTYMDNLAQDGYFTSKWIDETMTKTNITQVNSAAFMVVKRNAIANLAIAIVTHLHPLCMASQ